MTWQHFLRTGMVAALAAVALILAQQAHAESGDVWIERQLQAGMRTASADPIAPAADAPTAAASAPAKLQARRAADAAPAAGVRDLIARYASEHGIPYGLADAVVRIESRYRASARSGPHMGLTQINVLTAASLGYQGPASGLLDPETNLRYGIKYLAQAYKLAGGDTCGTILRYQAGHRATTMTSRTLAYCARVKAIMAQSS